MKSRIIQRLAVLAVIGFSVLLLVQSQPLGAQGQPRNSGQAKFEEYRKAIRDAYRVDIKNFKDRLPGGIGDGKPVTKYQIKELLEGIKFEREHTSDMLLALEMAMDHLERIPDYYTRLLRMERECVSDMLLER